MCIKAFWIGGLNCFLFAGHAARLVPFPGRSSKVAMLQGFLFAGGDYSGKETLSNSVAEVLKFCAPAVAI